MRVIPIKSEQAYPWLLNKHYAKRIPNIMFAFGLYIDDELKGVVTFGSPASPTLCFGICGKEHQSKVLELNRLCLMDNNKNESSFLVANAIKLLPKPSIVVSFADIKQGHIGYVYQSTNFIYTGLSAKRTDWVVKGFEHKHSKTLSDSMSIKSIKEKYGNDFYYSERSRKHRYVYFHGSKTDKKVLMNSLNYEVMPYPKGKSKNYDAGGTVIRQDTLF
jgi:hypothetical protein